MRWSLLAAAAAIAANLCLPGEAAEPDMAAAAPAIGTANDTISFEQYREWRNNYLERRRDQLAAELAAGNLPAARKARLEQSKAYYEWLAGLPQAERDRRYRERFDQIDADHNGVIDPAERAAWREKQRVAYRRDPAAPRAQPAAADH
jgi:hypothetical protein